MSVRKPHNDLLGYVSERRNSLTRDYNIILDCKAAADSGQPLVEDFVAEGGRYQILCNKHAACVHTTNRGAAYECMRDATEFCDECRELAKVPA